MRSCRPPTARRRTRARRPHPDRPGGPARTRWSGPSRCSRRTRRGRLGLPDGAAGRREDELAAELVAAVGAGRGRTLLAAPGATTATPTTRRPAGPRRGRRRRMPGWSSTRCGPGTGGPGTSCRGTGLAPCHSTPAARAPSAGRRRAPQPDRRAVRDPATRWCSAGRARRTSTGRRGGPEARGRPLTRLRPDARARGPVGGHQPLVRAPQAGAHPGRLPRERYGRVRAGCSIGALAAPGRAVRRAAGRRLQRGRGRSRPGAARRPRPRRRAPRGCRSSGRTGRFDLVSVSEVGYFLGPAALERLVGRALAALTEDGHLLLCHWRHPRRLAARPGPRCTTPSSRPARGAGRAPRPRLRPPRARQGGRDASPGAGGGGAGPGRGGPAARLPGLAGGPAALR